MAPAEAARVRNQQPGWRCRAAAILCLLWLGLAPAAKAAAAAKGQIDSVTAEAMTTGFNQGMAAFEKREWTKAIAEMEKVIALCENYPDKEAMAAAQEEHGPGLLHGGCGGVQCAGFTQGHHRLRALHHRSFPTTRRCRMRASRWRGRRI